MNGILPLIAFILSEIALLFVAIALIPILHEANNKRFIKYVFPIFIFLGFVDVGMYTLYLIN